jgi:hypothetical protein
LLKSIPYYLSQSSLYSFPYFYLILYKTIGFINIINFVLFSSIILMEFDLNNITLIADPTLDPTYENLSTNKYIHKYKNSLRIHWMAEPMYIDVLWKHQNYYIKLNCKVLYREDGTTRFSDRKPSGFRWQGGKYQYDLKQDYGIRPMAWRIPFLLDPNFWDDNMTVSHLCHNPRCYNWNHHILEPLEHNKARNGCPGLERCCHKIKCLRPGPYHNV